MKNLEDLKKMIEKKGGQEAVANMLGFSQPYISDIVKQRRDISIGFAIRLYDKFRIDPLPLLQWQIAQEWKEQKRLFDEAATVTRSKQ